MPSAKTEKRKQQRLRLKIRNQAGANHQQQTAPAQQQPHQQRPLPQGPLWGNYYQAQPQHALPAPTPAPWGGPQPPSALPPTSEFPIWCDGGFREGLGGAGVCFIYSGYWWGRSVSLGQHIPDNNAVELYAIAEALRLIAAHTFAGTGFRSVVIFSDSTESLNRIAMAKRSGDGDGFTLRVLDEERRVRRLGVQVRYKWVKGHSRDLGNRMANSLARYGLKNAVADAFTFGDNPPLEQMQIMPVPTMYLRR